MIDECTILSDNFGMRPIDQRQFGKLRRKRLAVCHPLSFLDEHKIGLHLDHSLRVLPDAIDLRETINPEEFDEIDVRSDELLPGKKYLGLSTQHISLPGNIWGLMHTRSTLARFGLDFFGSSYYVSPGFGAETPTQIVYEITVSCKTVGLPLDLPVAGLLLFRTEGSNSLWRGKGRHAHRFPFTHHLPNESVLA